MAAAFGRPAVRVNLDGGTTTDEVIGRYQLKEGATSFEYGVIPNAMRSGSVLILDEINAALPDVLFCIHALLDRPARLFVPETQETIEPEPGFCVVATMNPSHDYAGTKGLNAALYSRFGVVLRFEPIRGEALIKALGNQVPAADGETVAEVAEVIETIERFRREDRITTRATVREGIAALLLACDGLSLAEAVHSAIIGKLEPDEIKLVPTKLRAPKPRGSAASRLSVNELIDRARRYVDAEKRVRELEADLVRYAAIKNALDVAAAQERKEKADVEREEREADAEGAAAI